MCAAALSLQTLQLLHLSVNYYLLVFIFFATLCGYNAYWVVSKFSFGQLVSLTTFIQRQSSSFAIMLVSVAGMLYCMLHLHLVMYNIIITFFLLALYAVPLLPIKKLQFTRKAGFLKTILLAFTWAHVTVLIPLQKSIVSMQYAELLIFANRFLFMLMLCIIFDKRDAAVDKIRGMHSLATDIDPVMLHVVFGFIFAGYTFISYMMKACSFRLSAIYALLVIGIISLLLYGLSLKKRGYFFYYFLVDGLMFLSALLTSVASI